MSAVPNDPEPLNHLWIHLAEARAKARKLSARQLSIELAAVGQRQATLVGGRRWDQAVCEEAARRLRGIDGD